MTADAVDVAIIGAGPTGLFAAFYAGLRQMSVKLIDSLEILGGQLTTLYPEKYIYDVPGFPKILSKELAANLITQAMHYEPAVCLGEQVQDLRFDEAAAGYRIFTSQSEHLARSIIIAGGVGAFEARTLSVPNVKRFEGHGLHYFVKNIRAFTAKRVLIVGGGDSAVDWANALLPLAAEVTLIHRRDQFRAHEDSVAQLRAGSVKIKTFFELKSLEGAERIERATIFDNRTGAQETLELDAVLVNVGFLNSLGPIKNWQLVLDGGQIRVDSMMRTNRPRIFAAGDICIYPGKLKLIATGFGEACVAVNYAKHELDPQSSIFPGHSSTMGR